MPFSPADPAPYARAVTIPQHLTGAILANMMRCCGAIAARSRGNGYGGTDSIAAFGARVIHCRQTRPNVLASSHGSIRLSPLPGRDRSGAQNWTRRLGGIT